MLNRRHIRVKVMQTIYAMGCKENNNLQVEGKFVNESIAQVYNLYLLMLDMMVEVHAFAKAHSEKLSKKILATEEEKNPNQKFITNEVLVKLSENALLQDELDKRKLKNWRMDDEYVAVIFNELIASDLYEKYMNDPTTDFKSAKDFIIQWYTELIAPNDKLYDYIEDSRLTWLDDLPIVNMTVLKRLQKVKPNSPESLFLPSLFKNEDDKRFSIELLEQTFGNNAFLSAEIEKNTPNWDKERIADVDFVLIKMALCEFLKFPSIPVKATINEYLEIAKEYSTPKSSIFINGILDKLVKEYEKTNKFKKEGRGLK
ncbi:N utilization substance protein B [Dokdonia pacifica]|uniref:NusB antitermination factor n=1 Tax=Dokdonia pacifica TaxID=1627892 RepID=A0A239ARW0_9FLAO|nr:transcription antitermination protein NusB [Dokdonia pacifica]GGG31514.1 N utilization substance protein B [Dokdonia pacifica]SNR98357.1 NusB antitermination factor [Dokdonia pacifica]